MTEFILSNADTLSYLAGAASILGFIALFVFFAIGGIFGPINDAISVFQFVFLAAVAVALHHKLEPLSPTVSLAASIVGMVAMLLIAVLQLMLVLRRIRFEQTLRPILVAGVFVGIWWIIMSVLTLSEAAFPAGLGWVGVTAGVSFILIAIGFWRGGQRHPLAAVGFVTGAVGSSVWAIWLGTAFAAMGA